MAKQTARLDRLTALKQAPTTMTDLVARKGILNKGDIVVPFVQFLTFGVSYRQEESPTVVTRPCQPQRGFAAKLPVFYLLLVWKWRLRDVGGMLLTLSVLR